MADRVKYFLLGVLFLVVAGVIAYDRWNSAGEPQEVAERPDADTGGDVDMSVGPRREPLVVEPDPNQQPQPTPAALPSSSQQPSQAVNPTPAPPASRETPRTEPKPEPPAPDKTHVIKKGETLEAIAIKYYGTREGIEWIAKANRLGNANRIFANQKLIIPARKEMPKEGASGGADAAKPTGTVPSRYKVKDGDGDLYAICRRFYGREGQGARVARIMELNHLYSADVKIGTILILPSR
jgi:nucleoid-associated protein YgaU